ncbi:MAG TPA: universal stress protein [Smithellaceae bacterium]|nr:universal stress protein [Smithellaceae bacterium]
MKIAFGYDGSASANNALNILPRYAKEMNANIYIVTSIVPQEALPTQKETISTADMVKEAEDKLASVKKSLEAQGISCETHLLVRGMDAGEDIVKIAKELAADFILVGVGKTSRVGKMFFGSTAQYVILNAHCPVISVK